MHQCCVCLQKFELIQQFEIGSGKKTGIECGSGKHYICNVCLLGMYPFCCPICKKDIPWKEIGFPEDLKLQRESEYNARMKLHEQIENYEAIIEMQKERDQLCEVQNMLLLMVQLGSSFADHEKITSPRRNGTRRNYNSRNEQRF